jgi:hypothetical protein
VLGYGKLDFDLVITNQLIASAEYLGCDIHTAIRGGLTVGTTAYSRNSKFGSFIFWSTLPFFSKSEVIMHLHEGEEYSELEAAELSGTYLAHEIGHMLFQFGHPFGQASCVMNPVRMLRFREWKEHIKASDCQFGSQPQMMPGVSPPSVNSNWLKLGNDRSS